MRRIPDQTTLHRCQLLHPSTHHPATKFSPRRFSELPKPVRPNSPIIPGTRSHRGIRTSMLLISLCYILTEFGSLRSSINRRVSTTGFRMPMGVEVRYTWPETTRVGRPFRGRLRVDDGRRRRCSPIGERIREPRHTASHDLMYRRIRPSVGRDGTVVACLLSLY